MASISDRDFIRQFDISLEGPLNVFDGSLSLLTRYWAEILACYAVGAVPLYSFAFKLLIPPLYFMRVPTAATIFTVLWLLKEFARCAAVYSCQFALEGSQVSIRKSFLRSLRNWEVVIGQTAISCLIYLCFLGSVFNPELTVFVIPGSPLLLYQYIVNLMTVPFSFSERESYLSARKGLSRLSKGNMLRVFWLSILTVFFLFFLFLNVMVGLTFIAMVTSIFSAGSFEPAFDFLEGDETRLFAAFALTIFILYEVFFIAFSVANYRYLSNQRTGDDLITRLRLIQAEGEEE
ncbi:MAG: hypothetical protein Kow00107_05820 [Planctomycetota bacterium]